MSARTLPRDATPFYRDTRILAIIAQIIFVVAIVLVLGFFIRNMILGLRASNIPIGWGFLQQEAGFAISEGPTFAPSDTYLQAYLVGVANTLRIAVSGIILTTLLGLLWGWLAFQATGYSVRWPADTLTSSATHPCWCSSSSGTSPLSSSFPTSKKVLRSPALAI
ncbi:MAG: hypothetical protein R2856_06700 [Caldilineaceae bacterium]